MNEESNSPAIDPELEARIVAMLLGEASEFERENLRRLMDERPELVAFTQEMERLHGLLADVGGGDWEQPSDDWKLSDDRREKVLAAFCGESIDAPKPRLAEDLSKRSQSWLGVPLKIAAVLFVPFLGASIYLAGVYTQARSKFASSMLADQAARVAPGEIDARYLMDMEMAAEGMEMGMGSLLAESENGSGSLSAGFKMAGEMAAEQRFDDQTLYADQSVAALGGIRDSLSQVDGLSLSLGAKSNADLDGEVETLVEQFNGLMKDHRYEEAGVIAQQVEQIKPDNSIATNMFHQAELGTRVTGNAAELSDQLQSVDRSAIAYGGMASDFRRNAKAIDSAADTPVGGDDPFAESPEGQSKRHQLGDLYGAIPQSGERLDVEMPSGLLEGRKATQWFSAPGSESSSGQESGQKFAAPDVEDLAWGTPPTPTPAISLATPSIRFGEEEALLGLGVENLEGLAGGTPLHYSIQEPSSPASEEIPYSVQVPSSSIDESVPAATESNVELGWAFRDPQSGSSESYEVSKLDRKLHDSKKQLEELQSNLDFIQSDDLARLALGRFDTPSNESAASGLDVAGVVTESLAENDSDAQMSSGRAATKAKASAEKSIIDTNAVIRGYMTDGSIQTFGDDLLPDMDVPATQPAPATVAKGATITELAVPEISAPENTDSGVTESPESIANFPGAEFGIVERFSKRSSISPSAPAAPKTASSAPARLPDQSDSAWLDDNAPMQSASQQGQGIQKHSIQNQRLSESIVAWDEQGNQQGDAGGAQPAKPDKNLASPTIGGGELEGQQFAGGNDAGNGGRGGGGGLAGGGFGGGAEGAISSGGMMSRNAYAGKELEANEQVDSNSNGIPTPSGVEVAKDWESMPSFSLSEIRRTLTENEPAAIVDKFDTYDDHLSEPIASSRWRAKVEQESEESDEFLRRRELSTATGIAKLPEDSRTQTHEYFEDLRSSGVRGEALAPLSDLASREFGRRYRDTERDFVPSDGYEFKQKRAKAKSVASAGLEEKDASAESTSTFSLHVSDVSFKLAKAALGNGQWPEAAKIRVEEFVNAFDYGDPLPSNPEKVACRVEQAVHPFLQQRNLMRVSMRTAASGRAASTPLRLTFLLDNSGSMERFDRQQTVRRAFALLSQQLQPTDQVTLISFARQPRLLADQVSGTESQQLVQLVGQLPSEGGTNLESALQLAFEKAKEQQVDNAQNRIILLTDGAVNLGDANPQSLSRMITSMRESGIAFDAAGISAEGLNDEILESLTRKGDGRYYLLDSPDSADEGFVRQIAGALRPSAKNVKVQIQFNPERVGRYKLLGFEKHRLAKEDFRNDKVDAAEMAADEAGVAVYQFEAKSDGHGDIGVVLVRFQDLSTGQMVEESWPIPYEPDAARLDQAAPTLRVAASAAMLASALKGDAIGESVDLKTLSQLIASLPEQERNHKRIQELEQMIRQAREVSGK